MRDGTHRPMINCDACGEEFTEGVNEGYTCCLDCSCSENSDDTGDMCFLTDGHLGSCEFKVENIEPTPEEMAEVYRSLGVNPDESGTLL